MDEATGSRTLPRGLKGVFARALACLRARRVTQPLPLDWRREWRPLAATISVFLAFYFLPVGSPRFDGAVRESLQLTRWYAREHVILCLVPAFFIAGAISVFVNRDAVLRYLGPHAPKGTAYGVASVSGSLLAVCSCTVLPLFAGIYRVGAGLGPAAAFLYSGPAINVLAVILTARVLGLQIGMARAVGAVAFAILIGLGMSWLFRHREADRSAGFPAAPVQEGSRTLWQNGIFFGAMVGVLVFANWGATESASGLWHAIYEGKWVLTVFFALLLGVALTAWMGLRRWQLAALVAAVGTTALAVPGHPQLAFGVGTAGLAGFAALDDGELGEWLAASWDFTKQILPLLLVGILIAGMALGGPGGEGLIPSRWIAASVGGESLGANLLASVAGTLMYFATLTEVPILQGLLGSGMGNGPALALLLAGPALSLPSILVVRSVIGWKMTGAYVGLVSLAATVTGVLYGLIA